MLMNKSPRSSGELFKFHASSPIEAKLLVRPQTWLYLLAALLPFERIPALSLAGFNLRPSLVAALILVVVTLIQTPKLVVPKRTSHWALVVFLGICGLSSLLSGSPSHAWRITGYTILAAVLAVCVAQAVKAANLRTLCFVLLISSISVSLFAFYQFAGDLGGLPTDVTGLKAMYSGQVFGFPRVQAASIEPLYFANYLLLPLAILSAVGLFINVNILTLIVLDTAILLTLSRGGVIVAAITLVFLISLTLYRRRFKDAAKLSIGVIISLALTLTTLTYLVPALRHVPTDSQKPSAVSVYTDQVTNLEVGNGMVDRARTRKLAIEAFQAHPLLGVGPGNFGAYAVSVHSDYSTNQIVNNEPLELLAETGVIGFGVFMAFVVLLAREAILALRQKRPVLGNAILLGALVYLAATAIQYWSFSTLYIIQVWFAIGLVLGLSEEKS